LRYADGNTITIGLGLLFCWILSEVSHTVPAYQTLFLIQVVRVISTWVLFRSGSPLSIGGGREYY